RGINVRDSENFEVKEWVESKIGSYLLWGTAAVVEFTLQRDHPNSWSPVVTNLENNHWIYHSGVLTVAGLLQWKSDSCSEQRELESGF
ncbi:hypothetical protein HAX54_031383, partial [Datura stramonium]|nr:hypothetical protein [Datura stramonium]